MTSKEALNNCRYVAGLQIDWLCKKEFEIIEKDLERLEKQDKILDALLKNANYYYDEWYGMRGNQCIMICISENDECFEEVKELLRDGKD